MNKLLKYFKVKEVMNLLNEKQQELNTVLDKMNQLECKCNELQKKADRLFDAEKVTLKGLYL